MYISLSHFIVLILIMHVLLYDTRQENYYFIRKVIDKNQNVVEAEDWTYAHWEPVCFQSKKY